MLAIEEALVLEPPEHIGLDSVNGTDLCLLMLRNQALKFLDSTSNGLVLRLIRGRALQRKHEQVVASTTLIDRPALCVDVDQMIWLGLE